MLGGVAPLLIFNFPGVPLGLSSTISGIPIVGEQLASLEVGLPIPIYLDERLTGLVIESESRGIDIENENKGAQNSGTSQTNYQRQLDNTVQVNMQAERGNVALIALLALCDLAFTRVVSKRYAISYFSGSTVVIGGLLKGFNTQGSNQDTLVRVTLEISKANKVPFGVLDNPLAVSKDTGALPAGF